MPRSSESPNVSVNAVTGDKSKASATPQRTPSPVLFTTSSTSSRESTPSGKKRASAGSGSAIPSFTVTSSQYSPNGRNVHTHVLNPQAKAFEVPTSTIVGTSAPLFAMPAQRTSPSSGLIAMESGAGSLWGSGDVNSDRASASPNPQQQGEEAATQLESFIRQRYTPDCERGNLHMVVVFNLDPHTSRDALLQMFFPMGGSAAVVLRPSDFPPPLATTPLVSRRFVGVVFFPRKDFAMVGVEKLDRFVPNGQHQPLHVVYCGPDATTSSLSGSALPPSLAARGPASSLPWTLPATELEKVHAEMCARFGVLIGSADRTMVALHGLEASTEVSVQCEYVIRHTGALRCERWPPRQGRVHTPWRCRSISAVVWYLNEAQAIRAVAALDNKELDGQRYPLRAVLLPCQPAPGSVPRVFPSSRAGATVFDNGVGNRKAASFASVNVVTTEPGVNTSTATTATAVTSESFDAASRSFEEIHHHFLSIWKDPSVHLVAVHNLDPMTDKTRLFKIFYPIGAFDAELYPAQVIFSGKPRRSGVALFHSRGMAEEAATRINDFVPHNQTRPLITYLLTREEEEVNSSSVNVNDGGKAAATALATPTTPTNAAAKCALAAAAASTPHIGCFTVPSNATPSQLLESVHAQLAVSPVNATVLAETMAQLASHPDSNERTAKTLADTLATTLVKMQHHAVKLATPLSSALMTMHELLGIRSSSTAGTGNEWSLSGVPSSANVSTEQDQVPEADEKKVNFARQIARSMMILVTNNDASRKPRNVAAMLCGYFFQFSYLSDSPYAFAVRLLRPNEQALREAKAYLGREPGVPTTADAEKTHRPWITLVESLEEMTSLWRRNNEARYRTDPDAKQYARYINDFYDGNPPRSSCAGAGGRAGSGGSSPSCDHLSGTAAGCSSAAATTDGNGKHQSLCTPSARPTPRRVVTRVSSANTNSATRLGRKSVSGTGDLGVPTAGGLVAPHVVLSPASDNTQGVSADISLESNHPSGFAQSLRAMGALHSFQRNFSQYQVPNTIGGSARPLPPLSGIFGVGNANMSGTATATATANPIALSCGGVNTSVSSAASGGNGLPFQEHRSDCCECTVYITKLPSPFTAGQVHRMLSHFGEVNKVRLCRDGKENVLPGAGCYSKLCYGFVEFAEPYQAKAMVEYFRNAVHTPCSFEFLRVPAGANDDGTYFSEEDIHMLRSTRTSQARNPIHDQQPLDAVLRPATAADGVACANAGALVWERRCLFGILKPNVSIETYQDAVQNEMLPSAASPPPPPPQPQPQPQSVAAPGPTLLFFPELGSDAAETWCHSDPAQTQPIDGSFFMWQSPSSTKAAVSSALATPPYVEDEDDDEENTVFLNAAVNTSQGTQIDDAFTPRLELSNGGKNSAIAEDDEEISALRSLLAKAYQ